jgi:hypothetical protein
MISCWRHGWSSSAPPAPEPLFPILLPYGFKENRSTELVIIELIVDKITPAIDKGEYTIGSFLDLSKAFDTTKSQDSNSKTRTLWYTGNNKTVV